MRTTATVVRADGARHIPAILTARIAAAAAVVAVNVDVTSTTVYCLHAW